LYAENTLLEKEVRIVEIGDDVVATVEREQGLVKVLIAPTTVRTLLMRYKINS